MMVDYMDCCVARVRFWPFLANRLARLLAVAHHHRRRRSLAAIVDRPSSSPSLWRLHRRIGRFSRRAGRKIPIGARSRSLLFVCGHSRARYPPVAAAAATAAMTEGAATAAAAAVSSAQTTASVCSRESARARVYALKRSNARST